ncbi:transposase [Microbispora hainanensis]|uniref:transposase n=1 Tax=Microbispora hainanensis TaxID=568844 RepID=UPI00386CF892
MPESAPEIAGGDPVDVPGQRSCPSSSARSQPCPTRSLCTSAKKGGRQLTLRARPLQQALDPAQAEQMGKDWQDKYKLRTGVEGTMRQAIAVTGMRRARCLPRHQEGAPRTRLLRRGTKPHPPGRLVERHPLDRTRISHLARLELAELTLARELS